MNENELVNDLCNEFAQGIEDIENKRWLTAALVSHVYCYLKKHMPEDRVALLVRAWWPNNEPV